MRSGVSGRWADGFVLGVLVLVLALMVPLQKSWAASLGARHLDVPPHDTDKALFSGSFEDYMATMRARIRATRTDLTDGRAEAIIEGNAPFLLVPDARCPRTPEGKYARGLLFTHGLTDSPFLVRDAAEQFRQRCFLVMGLLLPGHGTRPGDLLDVSWLDWVAAEQFGVAQLGKRVEQTFMAGYSMGGTLSLYLAAGNQDIAGLFLFAPALEVSGPVFLAPYVHWLSHYMPRLAWMRIGDDTDPYRYGSFAMNAVSQIHALMSATRTRVTERGLPMPVYVVSAREDATVDTDAVLGLLQRVGARHTFRYYSASAETLPEGVEGVTGLDGSPAVISNGHLGVPVAPDNNHYGRQGDFVSCSHYVGRDDVALDRCRNHEADFVGEITAENLDRGVVQRITFNPDWPGLWASIDRFMATAFP